MLEPTEFHEHITQNNACNEDIEDYNFTMWLDDDLSTIGNVDKTNMNLFSNKSSKIDLNLGLSRPRSVSRKEFKFGNLNKCTSNSFIRQSMNPGTSCCNQNLQMNTTCQNPLTVSINRPLWQSVCGGLNWSQQFNNGFGSILAQHNHLIASQADLQPSYTVGNDRVVERLASAENMLRKMDKKVDVIRQEKHSTTKQLK